MKTVRSFLFTLALAVLLAAPASADAIVPDLAFETKSSSVLPIVLIAAAAVVVIGLLAYFLIRRRGGKK